MQRMFDEVFSMGNLYQAWQRVKESHGGAGVDEVTLKAFEANLDANLLKLQSDMANHTYRPLPLLRLLVEKPNGEARPLSIPAVRDRVAQAAVLNTIEPIFNKEFETCSFAYRKGHSYREAILQVKKYRDEGYRFIVDADIDAFFDNIDHDLLLTKVKSLIQDKDILWLIGMWVKAEVWDGKRVYRMTKGIPQGSVISPILANLFLDEFDEALLKKGYKLVRYADDFVILCKTEPEAERALELTDKVLADLKLILDEKQIIDFHHGFKYLGAIFLNDSIFVPFDRPKRKRKVLYCPPPLFKKSKLKEKI